MGLLDGVYCLGVSKEWSLRNFGHITSVFRCMTVGGLVCDCSWCRCVMLCIVYCGCSVMPYGHCGLCGRVLRGVSWRRLNAALEAAIVERFHVSDFKTSAVCTTCRIHGPPSSVS